MIIKYDSDKYEDVNTPFTLCKDIHGLAPKGEISALAREIMFNVFIHEYQTFFDCIGAKVC